MNDTTIELPLGDDVVPVRIRRQSGQDVTYLSLHDDENASVEGALRVVAQRGGRIVELTHQGSRELSFLLAGKQYTVDPNRMFSAAGIERWLAPYTPEAAREVAAFAGELWNRYLAALPLVVALHNNEPCGWSICSYEVGKNAVARQVEPGVDPDDFLLVTDASTFRYFQSYPINLVQENVWVTDDGSLSVHCGRQGRPYVNVETERGKTAVAEKLVALVAGYAKTL